VRTQTTVALEGKGIFVKFWRLSELLGSVSLILKGGKCQGVCVRECVGGVRVCVCAGVCTHIVCVCVCVCVCV
jgi:hypothetical protein